MRVSSFARITETRARAHTHTHTHTHTSVATATEASNASPDELALELAKTKALLEAKDKLIHDAHEAERAAKVSPSPSPSLSLSSSLPPSLLPSHAPFPLPLYILSFKFVGPFFRRLTDSYHIMQILADGDD